jgi:hypothetical protein
MVSIRFIVLNLGYAFLHKQDIAETQELAADTRK